MTTEASAWKYIRPFETQTCVVLQHVSTAPIANVLGVHASQIGLRSDFRRPAVSRYLISLRVLVMFTRRLGIHKGCARVVQEQEPCNWTSRVTTDLVYLIRDPTHLDSMDRAGERSRLASQAEFSGLLCARGHISSRDAPDCAVGHKHATSKITTGEQIEGAQ